MPPKIAIGSDHAGFPLKEQLKDWLQKAGYPFRDFGAQSEESADYPDFAHPVADAIEEGSFEYGVLVCGSANGVAITANKHAGVRAAVCWQEEIAELARKHNDANVICLPGRFISQEVAVKSLDRFLHTAFEGGRHARRVSKISC